MKKIINVLLYILFTNLYCAESKRLISPGGPEIYKKFIIKIVHYGPREGQEYGFIEEFYLSDQAKLNTFEEQFKEFIRCRQMFEGCGTKECYYRRLYRNDLLSQDEIISLKNENLQEIVWDVTYGRNLKRNLYWSY